MRVENEDSFYAAESLPKPRVRLSIEHFAVQKDTFVWRWSEEVTS